MSRDPGLVRKLENLIKKECQLYLEYIKLVKEEGKFLTKFDSEKLTALTRKRADYHDLMLYAQEERLNFMRTFPETEGMRLSAFIRKYFHPEDAKKLLPQANHLRELVIKARQEGQRHGQVVGFGLKIAHGLVSIIWSATQNVVNAYNRKGSLKKSYHPKSRRAGVLKQA